MGLNFATLGSLDIEDTDIPVFASMHIGNLVCDQDMNAGASIFQYSKKSLRRESRVKYDDASSLVNHRGYDKIKHDPNTIRSRA